MQQKLSRAESPSDHQTWPEEGTKRGRAMPQYIGAPPGVPTLNPAPPTPLPLTPYQHAARSIPTPSSDSLSHRKMGFGKHSHETMDWVRANQPGYCSWCLKQPTPSPQMARFWSFLHPLPSTSYVHYPDLGLNLSDWISEYISVNVGRGLGNSCWSWLNGLCGGSECRFPHRYPTSWTEEMRRKADEKRRYNSERRVALIKSYEEYEYRPMWLGGYHPYDIPAPNHNPPSRRAQPPPSPAPLLFEPFLLEYGGFDHDSKERLKLEKKEDIKTVDFVPQWIARAAQTTRNVAPTQRRGNAKVSGPSLPRTAQTTRQATPHHRRGNAKVSAPSIRKQLRAPSSSTARLTTCGGRQTRLPARLQDYYLSRKGFAATMMLYPEDGKRRFRSQSEPLRRG
ncbi:hypothetical protein HK104_003968 [Borealophlyctis nickersoniae]|nr:hypothetical protein HK104_003968 [Borealophlyctis nickersoniae]